MTVYLALEALPWEVFGINIADEKGTPGRVTAKSNASMAGFLPLYWSESAARAALPNSNIQSIEVPDNWHPMLKAMHSAAEEYVVSAESDLSDATAT